MIGYLFRAMTGRSPLQKTLRKHFGSSDLSAIATAAREFPITSRVDLQAALEDAVGARPGARLLGLFSPNMGETPTLSQVFARGPFVVDVGPIQYDEVDVGDPVPARCLRNGLWLSSDDGFPFVIFLSRSMHYGMAGGVHLEIGVPAGDRCVQFSQNLFRDLEQRVGKGRTYRGRIISLEAIGDPMSRGGGIKVHRLAVVSREDVILPKKTLDLLDRNVGGFIAVRDRIKALRLSSRKGLLFYGPPGTGKTHTIHYLASQLPGHTTLLITAEQIGLIGEYFGLARFLQPAMMIIEDVDLVARERTHMHGPIEEVLLNKLLNEMDGLREDADVMFILTTNRPDQLEPALASRPGRIDQAIEFPLPDDEGRAKLVALYARGLDVSPDVSDLIVRRTKGASAAFIKELMRRSAQFQIEAGESTTLDSSSVDAALEEMLFTGGALNAKLLGGIVEDTQTSGTAGGGHTATTFLIRQ